jgi:hypothetical protein
VTAPHDPGLATPDPATPQGARHRISEVAPKALITTLDGDRAIVHVAIRRPDQRKACMRLAALVEIVDGPAGPALVIARHPFNRQFLRRAARLGTRPGLVDKGPAGALLITLDPPASPTLHIAAGELPKLAGPDPTLPCTSDPSPPAPDQSGALMGSATDATGREVTAALTT